MEKKRLQFDFTEDALRELDELQRATGAPSRAELIRHSLRLLQWFLDEQNKKSKFLIDRDGSVRELLLLPFVASTNGTMQNHGLEKRETVAQD